MKKIEKNLINSKLSIGKATVVSFLWLLISLFLFGVFNSCKKYETITQPLNYMDYQSSIDTTFNYLEDIKDWDGINSVSE